MNKNLYVIIIEIIQILFVYAYDSKSSPCLVHLRRHQPSTGQHLLGIDHSIHDENICEYKCSINHLCSMAAYNRRYHRCHLFKHNRKHSISHPYRVNHIYSTYDQCLEKFSFSRIDDTQISITHCEFDSLPWQRALKTRSIIFQSYTLIGVSYLPCQDLCASVRHCAAVQYQVRGLYSNRCRLLRSAKPWDLTPSKTWTVYVKRTCHVKIHDNHLFSPHHRPLCNFKYFGQGEHKHNQNIIHEFIHMSEFQCQSLCSKLINCIGIEFIYKRSHCILLSPNFLRNDGSFDMQNHHHHHHHHIYMKISCFAPDYTVFETSLSECSSNDVHCNCHANPCHHGKCLSQQQEGYHYMFCNCDHGYTGHYCDRKLDDLCPCLNGGLCQNDHSSCTCSSGYYGDYCQIILD